MLLAGAVAVLLPVKILLASMSIQKILVTLSEAGVISGVVLVMELLVILLLMMVVMEMAPCSWQLLRPKLRVIVLLLYVLGAL